MRMNKPDPPAIAPENTVTTLRTRLKNAYSSAYYVCYYSAT